MANARSLVRPFTVQLTGVVEQEGEQYVSKCLELGTIKLRGYYRGSL